MNPQRPFPAVAAAPLAALSSVPRDDSCADFELSMSTHLAVVVKLRLEFADRDETAGLVIPRSRCSGNRPLRSAVQAGLRDLLAGIASGRRARLPQRVLACIEGEWSELAQATPLLLPPLAEASLALAA